MDCLDRIASPLLLLHLCPLIGVYKHLPRFLEHIVQGVSTNQFPLTFYHRSSSGHAVSVTDD